MTDIPSRLFGSENKWHFKVEHDLLTFSTLTSHFHCRTRGQFASPPPR
jgi:hypothetical protein